MNKILHQTNFKKDKKKIKYGLTSTDLLSAQTKIKKQKDWLQSQFFISQTTGEIKSLFDVSMSANHSTRYYAQLLNKVKTMDTYASTFGLSPVFLTATLDAPFHEMLFGKFDKFYSKYKIVDGKIYDRATGKRVRGLVPNDDRFGYILDDIISRKKLSIRDLYKILSFQMHRFSMSRAVKQIPKNGDEYVYIRVTEPMKSGVPHYHMLMYVKPQYFRPLYDAFHRHFSAPRNKAPLSMKENGRICTKPLDDGTKETQGFQWDIHSATGYVLKYALKSFVNVNEGKQVDYLQAWYIHHKIPRIITSHTLIPQWVYRKISFLIPNWFRLSEIRRNYRLLQKDGYYFESDSEQDFFQISGYNERTIRYDSGLLQIFHNGKLLKEFGEKKEKYIPSARVSFPTPLSHTDESIPLETKLIPVYFEDTGKTLYMAKGSSRLLPLHHFKSVSKMTLSELLSARQNFDFEQEVFPRLLNIENELIRRGVFEGELRSLNFSIEQIQDIF